MNDSAPILSGFDRAVLVFNPRSGKKKGHAIAEEFASQWNRKYRTPLLKLPTRSSDHIREIAAEHYDQKTLMILAGGDGTFSQALQGIAGKAKFKKLKSPLALLPAGTGNSYLRDFGVTTAREGIEAVFASIEHHRISRADAGIIRYATAPGMKSPDRIRIFFNMFGVGIVPEISNLASKMRLIGNFSYTVAALQKIFSYRNIPYALDYDGTHERMVCNFITLSLSKYVGGTMLIAPPAEIDDGKLFMVYPQIENRLKILSLFPKIFTGSHLEAPGVNHRFAREVRIRCEGKIVMNIDGESSAGCNPSIEVIPAYFSVIGQKKGGSASPFSV